jgi:hypothetical protein
VFVIEWQDAGVWALEKGDYFMRADGVGGAIATARARYTKDGTPRRVLSWPEPQEVIWTFETPKKRKQQTIPARS